MKNELALNATEYGLEPSKAKQMEAVFAPMVARFKELEADYKQAMEMPISDEACAEAKKVRLAYVKVRTAADKAHKAAKDGLLIQTRAIDGLRNIVKYAALDHEESLEEREKYYERLEAEKKQKLHEERLAEIQKYEYEGELDFGDMTDEVWSNFLAGTKANYQAKIEAERKAEQERIEQERRAKLEHERRNKVVRFVDYIDDYDNLIFANLTEPEFYDIVKAAEKKKADHEAEQERIRKENERLQKEREAAEKKAAAERKVAEEKARKEREEYEAKMKAERESRAKLEAEIKAKKEAEEAERKAKEEAESKAKAAPDKEKLLSFAKQIDAIPFPELATKQAIEISKSVRELLNKTTDYITKKAGKL